MCYRAGVDVLWHPAAEEELGRLTPRERAALLNAEEKLVGLGLLLGYPHTSAVQGSASGLRELRPRQGRSRWRALYRRIGDALILAIAHDALIDVRGFNTAVTLANERLAEIAED